jgi:hypothetical protein
MQEPMIDMLLLVAIPISVITIAAIYKAVDIYLDTKDQCNHTWSRWSDPRKGAWTTDQTRSCNKCNMHQQRIVQ